jgi:hypothetical protein
MATNESLRRLSDRELLEETYLLSKQEREATARLIAALVELDARRLYLTEGYSSLFAYCTRCLHLSEHAALNRIETARAASVFPDILDHIADTSLTITAVRLLRPVLTTENHSTVIEAARHKTTKEIEVLVAGLQPKPPVSATIRKLPALTTHPIIAPTSAEDSRGSHETQPALAARLEPSSRRPLVKPLSAETYRLQITISRATHDKLRNAQALMRHRVPNGDPALIVDRALDALLREVERTKCGRVEHPRVQRNARDSSRHIPAAVKREVWARDGARCAFRAAGGVRCAETNFLELHHVTPYASGGKATVENIQLRCRAHNLYEAERDFGLFIRECEPLPDHS